LIGEATIVIRKVPLPKNLQGPVLARRAVEEVAADAGIAHEENEALLVIASELATNAIIHGAEPVMLAVSCLDSEVTVEVADGDPCLEHVELRVEDQPAPGGRGLRIVAELADRWGIRRSRPGKTVWATKAVRLARRGCPSRWLR
jgi:anti-sigma regulatory factor (Ser/Thr protein kinase)